MQGHFRTTRSLKTLKALKIKQFFAAPQQKYW